MTRARARAGDGNARRRRLGPDHRIPPARVSRDVRRARTQSPEYGQPNSACGSAAASPTTMQEERSDQASSSSALPSSGCALQLCRIPWSRELRGDLPNKGGAAEAATTRRTLPGYGGGGGALSSADPAHLQRSSAVRVVLGSGCLGSVF